jgi:hypothetical protein
MHTRSGKLLFPILALLTLGEIESQSLVTKIQNELKDPFPPMEGKPDASIPHGVLIEGSISNSKIYPGTDNRFQVYVPAQYNPSNPACLLVKLDGWNEYESRVLDYLIAHHEVPVIIGLGITPGEISGLRFNRSYEFDSVNDHFPDYVLNELSPVVQKLKTKDGRAIRISPNGNDHAATGGSTGGIGAFTLAWQRPDQFARVYSVVGTFVSMRGGHDYPALIRKTDPKPIRIFLEDGSQDAWNPLFGSWYDANLNMESALRFAGYDVAHAWGDHGHDGRPGRVIFPDVMRWLWRDYPSPVKGGRSQNSTLQEVTLPEEGWRKIPGDFQSAAGLAANRKGEVYVSDEEAGTVYRIGSGTPAVFRKGEPGLITKAFGPDGTLYGVIPGKKELIALNADGTRRTIDKGVAGRGLVVTHAGSIYVSEASRVWQIGNNKKRLVDEGIESPSGVAFSPDGSLFYVAEPGTQWIYSYVVQPDGSLKDKQQFYWLHMTDIPNNSGAEDLAVDTHGNLYVATRMGIQICDQNGRVRAILPLPSPSGAVRSLCFGGKDFDVLYATDGSHVFSRRLKLPGFAPWAAPLAVKSQGAG